LRELHFSYNAPNSLVGHLSHGFLVLLLFIVFSGILTPLKGQWTRQFIDENLQGAENIFAADMDNDNDLDVVAAGGGCCVVWYEAPSWTKHSIDDSLDFAFDLYVVDMDGDNDLDVVATGFEADDVVWYEAPFWTKHFIDTNLEEAVNVIVADMDGDNDMDVMATALGADHGVVLYKAPFWTKHIIDNIPDMAAGLSVADINGDDTLDIVSTGMRDREYGNDFIAWYEGPTWKKHFIDDDLNGAWNIDIADINADDKPDVIATEGGRCVVWYQAPLWNKHIVDDSLKFGFGLSVADINGDDKLDIVAAGSRVGDIVWYEAPFWTKHFIDDSLDDAHGIHGLFAEDMDDDNYMDVVATGEDCVVLYTQIIAGIEEEISTGPPSIFLYQNYPNPFNLRTIINYELKMMNYLDLSIYNLFGQKVATLVSDIQPNGKYKIEWDASGFASGVYLYRIVTDNGYTETKKLILLR
jgi:hypothetical protein